MGYEAFESLCKSRGITPYRVAKDTGVTTATLSSWKAGRYTPKTDKLKILADYFGVDVDVFTSVQQDVQPKHYIDPETERIAEMIFRNPKLRALFDVANDIPPDDLTAVYDLLLRFKRDSGND